MKVAALEKQQTDRVWFAYVNNHNVDKLWLRLESCRSHKTLKVVDPLTTEKDLVVIFQLNCARNLSITLPELQYFDS